MPTRSFSQPRLQNKMWKKLFKVVSEQNSINDMRRGTMTFLVSSQITDCTTRFSYCSRQLLFNVMERFWAVVSCLVWPQLSVRSPQSWLSPRGVRRCLPSSCHALSSHSTVVFRKAPPQWNGRSRCQHVLISFLRFHTASVWNCSTTIHNKLKLCNRPWMVEISHVIRLACSCATILSLSAPS